MSRLPLRVCIIAANAYPVIEPKVGGAIGGLETRLWSLAKGLSHQPDVSVTVVVSHPDAPAELTVEGVRIVNGITQVDRLRSLYRGATSNGRWYRWLSRVRAAAWLLLTRPFRVGYANEWTARWPALERIPVDVFIGAGVTAITARALRAAQRQSRPFALLIASDLDLAVAAPTKQESRDQFGTTAAMVQYVLTTASLIIAQTSAQADRLSRDWSCPSAIVPNPIDLRMWDQVDPTRIPDQLADCVGKLVLWIGRADRDIKRPLELINTARALPDLQFVMVLNKHEPDVMQAVLSSLPPNVKVLSTIPFSSMPALFRKARLLVSTSRVEGMPNVFLQAAACRVPIVSLEVLKPWLEASGAGYCCEGDRGRFADTIRRLMSDSGATEVEQLGHAGRRYVEQHHDERLVAAQLRELLEGLCTAALTDSAGSNR